MSSKMKTEAAMTTLSTKRINALHADLASGTVIEFGGKTYTIPEAIAAYQACIDANASVLAKRTALTQAVSDRRSADAACRAFDARLKAWAAVKFPQGSKEAGDFGLNKKVATTDVATKALAAEKAKATRKARNTMGPVAKQKVKGTLPPHGVAIVNETLPNPDARMPGDAIVAVNGAAHPQQ